MPGAPGDAERSALPRARLSLDAPGVWRAIDFVSDLHLSAAMPLTVAAWQRWLRETDADAVLILGDLFEVWVGDDAASLPFERLCVEALADCSSRRTLGVMAGNRDFLLGAAFVESSGALGMTEPTVLTAFGQRLLLTHGDLLCLGDHDYQTFRRQVRGQRWQREFLAKPLAERQRIAASIRSESRSRQLLYGREAVDIDPAASARWLREHRCSVLVHGHTHRPGSDAVAPGLERQVLSDWDLDDPSHPRAQVLRLTARGFERRLPFVPAAAR
jgi:UDP-2,3-diacylglucosamine hydrolase